MSIAANVLSGLVAFLHCYFLVLESFLWTTPFGRKTMGSTVEQAETTKVLAQNQGLYNGFLASGIIWAMLLPPAQKLQTLTFFLACVIVAGIVGAATANKKILFIQAVPAALALGAVWLAR